MPVNAWKGAYVEVVDDYGPSGAIVATAARTGGFTAVGGGGGTEVFKPSAPTNVTVTQDTATASATISFGPPVSDGGGAITGYPVDRDGVDSAGAGAYATVKNTTAPLQFTFTKLVSGNSYNLRVAARNPAGDSPYITVPIVFGGAEPPPPPPPPPPTALKGLLRVRTPGGVFTPVRVGVLRLVVDQDFSKYELEENYVTHATNEPYPLGVWPHVPWFLEPSSGTKTLDHLHIRDVRGARQLVKSGNNTFHRAWSKKRLGGPGTSVVATAVMSSDVQPQTSSGTIPGFKMGMILPGGGSIYPADDPRGGSTMGGANAVPASMQVFTGQTRDGYIEISQQVFGTGYRFSWQLGTPAKKIGYVNGTEQVIKVRIDWLEGNLSTKTGRVRFRLFVNKTLQYDFLDEASPLWGYSGFWRLRTDDSLWSMKSFTLEELSF